MGTAATALLAAFVWIATNATVPEIDEPPTRGSGDERGPGAIAGLESANDPSARLPEGAPERSAPASSPTVRVRAVDAVSGAVVTRFWVRREGFGEFGAGIERFVSDPANGTAEVPRSAPPAPLSVRSDRYVALHTMEPAPPADVLEVRLERATSIVGTVRDGSSLPLASAAVWLEWYGDGDEALGPGAQPKPFEGATLRRTDGEGRYAFTDLATGVYATRVEVAGTVERSERQRIRAGAWTTLDHWLDEHVRLSALVLRPDGLPAAASLVILYAGEADEAAVKRYTDEEGRAVLGPLAPGTYRVEIVSDDGRFEPETLVVEAQSASTLVGEFRLRAASVGD